MKAGDTQVRDDCPHGPIDHASQAALESTDVTGADFDRAYSDVFATTRHAVNAERDTADVLAQVRVELLRVAYAN
jgi:hypothetical protein